MKFYINLMKCLALFCVIYKSYLYGFNLNLGLLDGIIIYGIISPLYGKYQDEQ
jgi:hypothetical protein